MPNKAVSKAQFRLLKSIAEGSIKPKGKLTASVASEMLGDQSITGLPERTTAAKTKRHNWKFK